MTKAVTQQTPENSAGRPHYGLRRAVAGGALVGAALIGTGVAKVAGYTNDKFTGSDVPTAQDVKDNPNKYVDYHIKPDENLSIVAKKFTNEPHLVANNTENFIGQNGGNPNVHPGDTVKVDPNSTTTTQPNQEG